MEKLEPLVASPARGIFCGLPARSRSSASAKAGLLAMTLVLLPSNAFAVSGPTDRLVAADFDSGRKPSNLGGDWGTWDYDAEDPEQGSFERVDPDDHAAPGSGHCLRLDYDVQSKKPAFNGFWLKLKGLNAEPYAWFSFYVRGDSSGKFTKRFKVELKNKAGQKAVYLVDEVTPEWKEVRIPLKKSKTLTRWKGLTELVVTFDDILATYKEGTVYLDQIEFQK